MRDSTLDRMLSEARSTPDSARKVDLLRSIDRAVFELAPWLFMWFPADLWSMRPEVDGWKFPVVFTGQR